MGNKTLFVGRLFKRQEQGDGDTPIEVVVFREGIMDEPEPARYIPPEVFDKYVEIYRDSPHRKVFAGHPGFLENVANRDPMDWIAVAKGEPRVVETDKGRILVDEIDVLDAEENQKAKLFKNIVDTVPDEVQFSAIIDMDFELVRHESGVLVWEALDVYGHYSLDWVMYGATGMGLLASGFNKHLALSEEIMEMNKAKFKELFPDVYAEVVSDALGEHATLFAEVEGERNKLKVQFEELSKEKAKLEANVVELDKELTELKAKNEDAEKTIKELKSQLYAVEYSKQEKVLEAKGREMLAESNIPEPLHDKVLTPDMLKGYINVDEGANLDGFSEYMEKEIKDWEEKLQEHAVVGLGKGKDADTVKEEFDAPYAEENKRLLSKN